MAPHARPASVPWRPGATMPRSSGCSDMRCVPGGLLRRARLAPASPELLASLTAFATHWADHPGAAPALALAHRARARPSAPPCSARTRHRRRRARDERAGSLPHLVRAVGRDDGAVRAVAPGARAARWTARTGSCATCRRTTLDPSSPFSATRSCTARSRCARCATGNGRRDSRRRACSGSSSPPTSRATSSSSSSRASWRGSPSR